MRLPCCGIRKVKIPVLMIASDRLNPHGLRIHPSEARNIILPRLETSISAGKLDPNRRAARGADYAHTDLRVGVAGLRKALHIHRRVRGNPIGDRILRHRSLVHLQKDEPSRVRRPEIVAANVQLFLVNPIHLSVERGRIRRSSHRNHRRAGLFYPRHCKPVVAHKGDVLAVGRKLRIVPGTHSAHADLHSLAAIEIVEPQFPVRIKEQLRRIRSPNITGHLIAIAMVAVGLVVALTC